jgi:uncharacterized protein (DUF1800 family)
MMHTLEARMRYRALLAMLCAVSLALPAAAQQLSARQQALHVLNRLAYGPRPGDVERVEQMGVQNWIAAQLHPDTLPLPAGLQERLATLDTVDRSAGAAVAEYLALRRDAKNEDDAARQRRREAEARSNRQAEEARLLRAIDSPRQLQEVMVDFWYNHFNVFIGKGIDRALVASYERDAIRPYALGSFRDLLGATAKHPAMLVYLDNAVSTAKGLNENYARELMELHTLGVDTGYGQHDVTELARMLSGWTFDQRRLAKTGETFRFDPKRHDAGTKTWLGHEVAPAGQAEGEYALDMLANHPATARHVSRQLAQYFVSDDPPPQLVARMAGTWLSSGGDIRAVLTTLFSSAEFMAAGASHAKFKTPYQFVVSAVRASSVPVVNVGLLVGTLNGLGMPLYGCQTPDGYANTQAAWLNPDALTRRIAFATALAAGRLALGAPPAAVPLVPSTPTPTPTPLDAAALQTTLAGAMSQHTLDIVGHSPDNLRAAMLLGSPDFMQR